MGKNKTPYDERTDDEKLESNWTKAEALFEREDWSAAIMRTASASEIAANIYVRHFLLTDHELPPSYVDALLFSANGLDGKFRRLIKPAAEHRGTWAKLRPLQKKSRRCTSTEIAVRTQESSRTSQTQSRHSRTA